MKTTTGRPKKVRATLAITKEAQDIMLDNGYCSVRGMGEFISQLIVDYHARRTGAQSKAQLVADICQLVDKLAGDTVR